MSQYGNYRNSIKPIMQWISVKDRLPEKNQRCLVFAKYITGDVSGQVEINDWVLVSFHNIHYSGLANVDYYEVYASGISHWISLPEPPKE